MASRASKSDKMHRRRERLFRSQKNRCYYCGRKMVLARGPSDGRCQPRLATIDHIIPKSCGGAYEGNSVAACFECNNGRGDMDARDYLLMKMGLL